jgi:hypothetical protein
VVDRSLREVEPGVYASRIKLPVSGRMDVAFSLDSPRMLHCFALDAAANPRLASTRQGLHLAYLVESPDVKAGATTAVRFRITDGPAATPRAGLADVRVLTVRVPGRRQGEVLARDLGGGVYEAQVPVREAGAYYVYVASASLNKSFMDMPFLTLRATASPAAAPPQ